jgi:predicted AAA+ superfamily ATPase
VLDEIQYAPEVVAALKRQVDRDRRPGRYVLTGSQQWGVLRKVAESLAGRAVFLDLDGFALAELVPGGGPWLPAWLADPASILRPETPRLQHGRALYEILWRGSLPEACLLPLDMVPTFHRAYQRTYVERDARLLADVSDWQTFGRFMRLCAALTAQEVNHAQVGREIGVTHQTARRWLDVLSATFQWIEVPAWSGNAVKRVSGRPKGFLSDTGLACAAQVISTPQAIGGHPLQGALFETAVFTEIRKQAALLSTPPNMYHWRSHGGAEVDVVLEYDGRLLPIEAKATTRPSRKDASGIAAFRKTCPERCGGGLIVCACERALRIAEDVWAIPWDLDGRGVG